MKILITGGAGCLGSNLIEHWLPQGHEIVVLDNFATGKREVVPDGVAGLKVVEGDVADRELLSRLLSEHAPEIVVHSAAAYKDPQDWLEDTHTNVAGSINVAKAVVNSSVRQVINFQTALCYGHPDEVPIPSTHPTRPFTSYGISKSAGEAYLLSGATPVVSLRLANICGPRLAIGPIPTFYKRLKAGQNCFCSDTIRDFLDMSDFLALMDQLISSEPSRGVFNVSTGTGHSIKDIFDAVCKHLDLGDVNVPIVPPGDDDVPQVVLDPAETTATFGWQAKLGFEQIISRQLGWYDEHGINDIYSHLKPSV